MNDEKGMKMSGLEAADAEEVLSIVEHRESANKSLYGFPIREEDKRRDPNHKRYDIKGLWSRHKEIINLDSLGYKHVEIARMLGIHPVTVSMTLNSTLGKGAQLTVREQRDGEYEQLREEVMDLTRKSLDVYRDILDSGVESAKMKKETADTITLELAGMRAPTKIHSLSAHAILTAEELEGFKKRGIEAARVSGKVVDIGDE